VAEPVRLFLSTVSDEFRTYRDQLRGDLTRHNVEVKVQEDFKDLGGVTLEKLDDYIKLCDAVVHLVGDMTGADAGKLSTKAILQTLAARAKTAEPVAAASPLPAGRVDASSTNAGTTGGQAPHPPRTDFGALRSVRSAVYQGADTSPRGPVQSKVLRSAQLEDLKRIRGIGVLIEKKLNQMGVVAYEQIANWTAEDVDRVSQSLDFKGRIERENWVEQARILASGGATEFSRRVDRGEVETNRYRP
jgi:predicted flap endonuclease-1-like 5' DNA nuclease